MRKLYLHIGFDKTGTTSLQRFLSEQRGQLQNVVLPYLDGSFSPPRKVEFSHHILAESFLTVVHTKRVFNASRLTGLQNLQPGLTLDTIIAGLDAQMRVEGDSRPILLSSETFCRDMIDVNRLFAFVKDFDYTVVAALRRT